MFYVDSETDNIYLSKGDTAVLDIALTLNDEPYVMSDTDTLVFAMKRKNSFDVVDLEITSSTPEIAFTADSTNALSFGEYDYSITLYYNNGKIDTFVTGTFTILGVSYNAT